MGYGVGYFFYGDQLGTRVCGSGVQVVTQATVTLVYLHAQAIARRRLDHVEFSLGGFYPDSDLIDILRQLCGSMSSSIWGDSGGKKWFIRCPGTGGEAVELLRGKDVWTVVARGSELQQLADVARTE
jgi:hypothetical protein